MKPLSEIQEYVREKCGNHKCTVCKGRGFNVFKTGIDKEEEFSCRPCQGEGLIMPPLTLARVLNALRKNGGDYEIYFYLTKYMGFIDFQREVSGGRYRVGTADWKLLNEDGTECVFSMQDESTQRSVYKLLGGTE